MRQLRVFAPIAFLAVLFLAAPAFTPAYAVDASTNAGCIARMKQATDKHDGNYQISDDCLHLGPFRLGMSRIEIETLLGPADNEISRENGLTNLTYLFPRSLKDAISYRGPTVGAVPFVGGGLSFFLRDGRVMALMSSARSSDFPHDFLGVKVGDSEARIYDKIGRPLSANGNRDNWHYGERVMLGVGRAVNWISFAAEFPLHFCVGVPGFSEKIDPDMNVSARRVLYSDTTDVRHCAE